MAQETPALDAPTPGAAGARRRCCSASRRSRRASSPIPALRALGRGGIRFVLALTVGLLVYLLIDTLSEGLEAAAGAIDRLRAQTAVWVVGADHAGAAAGARPAARQRARRAWRSRSSSRSASASTISAKGSPSAPRIAAGEAALATFLVVGFTIHNVSEGFGIATPLIDRRPSLRRFRRPCGARRAAGRDRRLARRAGGEPVLDRRSASASAPAPSCRSSSR